MRALKSILWLLVCASVLTGADLSRSQTTSAPRPATWAVPLKLEGVPNFYQVTTNLYRGAEPSAAGMKALQKMGIRTIINLRSFHSDAARISGTGLQQDRIRMEPWHAANNDVIRFLKIMADTNNLPAFVHCRRGADRTGLVCAIYRIAICGWTKQQAIEELKHGGFRFSPIWVNIVHYIQHADIQEIRRRAGLVAKIRPKDNSHGSQQVR